MSNQEKQHKKGFMDIYKGSIGNQRKKELDHDMEKEKKSSSRSWLQRIRNPTRSFNFYDGQSDLNNGAVVVRGGGKFVEARISTSCLELESKRGYVEGRKSVSCIETSSLSPSLAPAEGIIVEEGRKSVSHIDTKLAAKMAGRIVQGRNSESQIETLSSVAAYLHVKILVSDMPSFMQVDAFRCARRTYDSLQEFSSKHIAHNMKKEFDKAYGPVWHCIVGSSFGSFVTHSTGCFLYFSMENLYILLFKTKVKNKV